MKAIIIAAGRGARMQGLTRDLPKCMAVVLHGKTLLETQLETLRSCGIYDISVVKGYKAEKIAYPDVTYYLNDNYEENNILESLFYAERELDDDVVVAYGDIWYHADIVKKLISSKKDIVIAVDTDWKNSYRGRKEHPEEEAELVVWNEKQEVVKIGKIARKTREVGGEFIGMIKLSRAGCDIFKKSYHRARDYYSGKPFQGAPFFQKAYLTDLFQEMVVHGTPVSCEVVGNEWREIDTKEDFERALEFTRKRTMGQDLNRLTKEMT